MFGTKQASNGAAAAARVTASASRRGKDGAAEATAATDPASDPERQLWCAVIIHTLYEAAGRIAYAERGEYEAVRREAVAWFEDAGEDFCAVCDLAGFIPGAVRDGALQVIQRGRLPRMRIPKAG